MDKRITLAVAGSGKTTFLVENLDTTKRALVLTYTINNVRNLREKIVEKFGCVPQNIELLTYFTFLHSFCYRPFLAYKIKSKGIFWDFPPEWTSRKKRTDRLFYLTEDGRLYHNRIAKLLEQYGVFDQINTRLEKYYDCIFIDEIQDFGGHDFNLLKSIARAKLDIRLVGDFFQHTFDTSRDGTVNQSLHEDYEKYQKEFSSMGVSPDKQNLSKSWRCSPSICDFISNNLNIEIHSHRDDKTAVKFIDDSEEATAVFNNNGIIKLFYQESYKYKCFSRNWGDSKGENRYGDVCVVLNKTTMERFKKGKLSELPMSTRNKLYVACSRARGNLFLLPETLIKHHKAI